MPGWVEEHSDVLLRLVTSHGSSEGERSGDRRIQTADLEVEVHHRTLFPVRGRPDRSLVVGCLLEHDVDGAKAPGSGAARNRTRNQRIKISLRHRRRRGWRPTP